MTPYYQDDHVTLYHGDALEILPRLDPVALICTDPPYGRVKGGFDFNWKNQGAFLADAERWRDAIADRLKDNGTLWWFAWPTNAAKLQHLISQRLRPIAEVVWIKPNPHAGKHNPELLRQPAPETERILMFEQYGANSIALGEQQYRHKCQEARGFIFEPLRAYLAAEVEAAGHSVASINRAWREEKGGKGGMASHWLTTSQWQLPTAENYKWLQGLLNKNLKPYSHRQADHKKLKRDYDHLRAEYENLRRYFKLERTDPKTELWRFNPSCSPSGHPTEKPLDLMLLMVRISSRPGDTILDPFAGSGTTLVAAKQLNRKAIGIEKNEEYCKMAVKRLRQEYLNLEGLTI